jgi:hypothetical protein
MEVEAKWDMLEIIQSNVEDWDCYKGKESGINYEYDCIKSFIETADFQELSAKNVALILKLWLVSIEPLLLILMFPKEIGMCIMNLLKTLAWKVKLSLMIAINILKLLKVLFLISMLIFVEHLDLVKIITSKKIIVSTTGVKKLECGTRL